jgi:hypothetical protein
MAADMFSAPPDQREAIPSSNTQKACRDDLSPKSPQLRAALRIS